MTYTNGTPLWKGSRPVDKINQNLDWTLQELGESVTKTSRCKTLARMYVSRLKVQLYRMKIDVEAEGANE